ncbi:hypothetical protein CHS0354_024043 [Potamilus streckersoni]|uniref:Uncharacterized protein n=1 Tax=Potamilus streckersoni TaxID=2493646 RepID=A0AAE0VLZ5_9BIVA|nr:hypothetical protein CHS0354_024043 [Potamilus streckersoni]
MRVAGVFTGTTISPSTQPRQCPDRYAIRAGRNLPDKEFRYLRTVIVTAAVYRGFNSELAPLLLTFRHRAGVRPYTSPCGFAEPCVFGKQSLGPFHCGLPCGEAHLIPKLRYQFAEFLLPSSLKRLRILISPTCVGLRYEQTTLSLRSFSWQHAYGKLWLFRAPYSRFGYKERICQFPQPTRLNHLFHQMARLSLLRHSIGNNLCNLVQEY